MVDQLGALHGVLHGLPLTYNKDLQDDKRALFDAVDVMLMVLPAVAGAVAYVSIYAILTSLAG